MFTRYWYPIDNVLSRLHGVQESSEGWIACCPAHGDTRPSLSIAVCRDERVLLHCHVGCEIHEIVDATGMQLSELYPQLPAGDRRKVCRDRFVAPDQYLTGCRVATYSDLGPTMIHFERSLHRSHVQSLADNLGVHVSMLTEFRLGWSCDSNGEFWAIPETNLDGQTIGIMRRYYDGTKLAYHGSSRGLIVPPYWNHREGPVFIVEGFSDAVVLNACGVSTIGRPSASGGSPLLALFIDGLQRQAIVVGENDQKQDGSWPGWNGAVTVSQKLTDYINRSVPVLLPPSGFKDVRSLYLQSGIEGVRNWISLCLAS